MKSNYWFEKRSEKRLINSEKLGNDAILEVEKIYGQALKNLTKEINSVYANYSKQTGLDVSELSQILNGSDRKKFLLSIQEQMRNLGFRVEDVYKPEYIARISRLEALKQQIYWEIKNIAPKEFEATTQRYSQIVKNTYESMTYDVEFANGIKPSFATLDTPMINQLLREDWQGRNYSESIWKNTNKLVNGDKNFAGLPTIIGGALMSGASQQKTNKLLREGFKIGEYEATRLIRTETNHFNNQAELQSYQDMGIERYQFSAVMDKFTSEICRDHDGDIHFIDEAVEGENYPPLHPNSYHKDTDVYTERGFVPVSSVKVGELVMSLSPETRNLEWVRVVKTFKHMEDSLIRFGNSFLDLEVTKDHDLLIQKRWNSRSGGSKLEFVKAKDCPPEARFYRSSEWQGIDIEFETFGMTAEGFCEFMGYYLSEGSTTERRSDIKISQYKSSGKSAMRRFFEESGLNFTENKDGFVVHNIELQGYLKQFGKCFEKYIPSEIKMLSKNHIRIFLDAYNVGDGSTRKGKNFKGGNFSEERTYFTSSKRLADDIGELLVKVGKRPSYYLMRNKGKLVKHHNGDYVGNYDIWIIRECNAQFCSSFSKEEVEYNDFVYCIELEKNHTLYVRKSGKCVWSGNCRSTTIPILEGEGQFTGRRRSQTIDAEGNELPEEERFQERNVVDTTWNKTVNKWSKENANKDIEYGAIISRTSGDILERSRGNYGELNFTLRQLGELEGNILIHNHPYTGSKTNFSPSDVVIPLNRGAYETIVVGKEGKYHMRFGDITNMSKSKRFQISEDIKSTYIDYLKKYPDSTDIGSKLWELISKRYGFTYWSDSL